MFFEGRGFGFTEILFSNLKFDIRIYEGVWVKRIMGESKKGGLLIFRVLYFIVKLLGGVKVNWKFFCI